MNFTINQILNTMRIKNYKVFYDEPSQSYNLNIVGVRNMEDLQSNKFNDKIYVFYGLNVGSMKLFEADITTDPGRYWRENPENVFGTAILKPNQYRSSFKIGLHQGKYKALVQAKPVIVFRDNDKDAFISYKNNKLKEDMGFFGINIHRANSEFESKLVDKWSAGCQVFANPNKFNDFILLCDKAARIWGNLFTYTLLESSDII